MATDVIMPALGMAQETGRIVRWLKASGDSVREGEPLLQIETDKSVVELEAPADGLLHIVKDEADDAVPIGEVVGVIAGEGEEIAPPPAADASNLPSPPPAVAAEAMMAAAGDETDASAARLRVPMSPKARRLAQENGLDVAAFGAGGQPLHAADVLASAGAAATTAQGGGQLRNWNGIWETMASRTAKSWRQAPHFYLVREVDASQLKVWLQSVRRDLPSATVTDLLIRVVAHALAHHPRLNASPAEGGSYVHHEINIGIAVATDRGLLVPVVRAADRLGLPDIVQARTDILARSREGRATPQDLSGGTFTISNLGMYGVDQFMPVLNLDEALLLAVGRMHEKVVVDEGRIVARPIMALTLACDHRVADGASAAAFFQEVVTTLEQPVSLIG